MYMGPWRAQRDIAPGEILNHDLNTVVMTDDNGKVVLLPEPQNEGQIRRLYGLDNGRIIGNVHEGVRE